MRVATKYANLRQCTMCHSEYYFVGKCVCLFPCEFYFRMLVILRELSSNIYRPVPEDFTDVCLQSVLYTQSDLYFQ